MSLSSSFFYHLPFYFSQKYRQFARCFFSLPFIFFPLLTNSLIFFPSFVSLFFYFWTLLNNSFLSGHFSDICSKIRKKIIYLIYF
ncbi:unnamed protein product [Meloidogyne enterolobii]|uniref:Uncharacterized protein n=1 Tax=Meloidogyne enterolobii TaxID=390850 RepID=A0ACB0Z6V2_MELEN